jgi:hypothetical protein
MITALDILKRTERMGAPAAHAHPLIMKRLGLLEDALMGRNTYADKVDSYFKPDERDYVRKLMERKPVDGLIEAAILIERIGRLRIALDDSIKTLLVDHEVDRAIAGKVIRRFDAFFAFGWFGTEPILSVGAKVKMVRTDSVGWSKRLPFFQPAKVSSLLFFGQCDMDGVILNSGSAGLRVVSPDRMSMPIGAREMPGSLIRFEAVKTFE